MSNHSELDCIVDYYDNKNIKYEIWTINFVTKHRNDGPAVKYYYPCGQVQKEEWYIDGKWYRENGPTSVTYYENGQICTEFWVNNDVWHRENGPAYILYDKDGQIENAVWRINNKWHREDGPASIKRDKNELFKEYYWNDYNITDIVLNIFGSIPDHLTTEQAVLLKLSLPMEYFR